MLDTKPATLPDDPPDSALFGLPTNERPTIAWPEPVPRDRDRVRHVSEGATHVVIAEHFGIWERGDKLKESDLPAGGHTLETISRIQPYPPLRPLRDDERPKAEEVTRHDPKAKVVEKPVLEPLPPMKPVVEPLLSKKLIVEPLPPVK